MVIHLNVYFCFLLSLSILLPTSQGDDEKGLDTGMCTGMYWQAGIPSTGTKCAEYKGQVCCQKSGYWGKSFCYTDTKGSNWGAECVKCSDLAKNAKTDYTNCIENPEGEGCSTIVSHNLPYLLQKKIIKEGEIGVNDGSLLSSSHYLKQWAKTLTLRKVGEIKTNKTDNEMVTINGTVNGQTGRKRNYKYMTSRPTGLYAGPGDLVTLTFPKKLVGKVSIDIGHYQFKLSFPVRSAICKIGSPYGGLIIVRMNNKDSCKGEFEVSVTNAIRAPTFIYGKTTDEQWEEMRHYSPKWSVLRVPGQVDIYVQILKIKDITEMDASMARIKNTMDILEESVGLRPGSQPGAEIVIIDPARGGGSHAAAGGGTCRCKPGTNFCGDKLHTEDEVNNDSGYDAFFKEDGTHHTILHEFGHGFCVKGFTGMGEQWTAENVAAYVNYVKGRYDKYNDVVLPYMVAKDLDFFILERMVGFAMYSEGKPCGEAIFDKKQFDPVGQWFNCWKWLNWLPSKEYGWHTWKDVNTINAKSSKNYKSGIDKMVDMYCQATQHNMLPMFDFWNIKPSDEAITNKCEKLPEPDLITKWVNIAKCVKQSMTDEQDIRECGKMPRFPEHKGLCVMSGVCNEDQTNKGAQTIMNKKFDLYGGSSRKRYFLSPFSHGKYEVSKNKETCFKRAADFFADCKNTIRQPITATFYGKEEGNEFTYTEYKYSFPPAVRWRQLSGEDCLSDCGNKGGPCPGFCGIYGNCCRVGYGDCPFIEELASSSRHTCLSNKTISEGYPTMSSVYSPGYSAEKCMDEKRNTYCYSKKGRDEKPYFMIEYTKPVMVNQVRLIAAKKYPQHAKNIMVIVTNDATSSGTQFGSIFKGPATNEEKVINFQPETGIMGKYVIVKRQEKGIITFAEVQVNPESLGLRCNGMDEGCCTTDNPCGNGDGDCDSDSECEGDLICGNDNCPWKDGDSCCKKPRPGKPTMSSEWSSSYSAKKCMDEKRNTYCYNKRGGDEKPYFMIEYATPVMINQVRLIAAKDYPKYAKNIMVIVTNDPNSSGTQFGSIFKGPATKGEEVINFQPETGIMGKYVIVKQLGKGVITFAEVEVNPEN